VSQVICRILLQRRYLNVCWGAWRGRRFGTRGAGGDGHGAVQRDHGRRLDAVGHVMERDDPGPIRVSGGVGELVDGCDGGLQGVGSEAAMSRTV
jgi:hypothetical protein